MENDLSNYRKTYQKGELLLKDTPENPLQLFKKWFDEVDYFFPEEETNTMTLSTIGIDGFPGSRIVLLKKYSSEGFLFFTNYNSDKGKAILENPNICLSFFWQHAERQVIIKGKAEKTSEKISDIYFKERPRGSQFGALASDQSSVIQNREALTSKVKQLEIKHKDKPVPRPEFWGGFAVKPIEIEFWQGRPNRLHDRIKYTSKDGFSWEKCRLSP